MRKRPMLGGRNRKMGDSSRRARSAVTWRIRHAIQESCIPRSRDTPCLAQNRRLCSYEPEKETHWFV